MNTKYATSFLHLFVFGNYFYGACALALAVETNCRLGILLCPWWFYVLLFSFTVFYYTQAYRDIRSASLTNMRWQWYSNHAQFIRYSQFAIALVIVSILVRCIYDYWAEIITIPILHLLLLGGFPMLALWYYGLGIRIQLRRIAWLKPFVIGLVWAGLVTLYPWYTVLFINHQVYQFTTQLGILFFQNFIFISVLAIMFDIKDYADDSNQNLKTFVAQYGLRITLCYVLIPLIALGLLGSTIEALAKQASLGQICIQTIPYCGLLWVANALQHRRSILYYLIIIDGLMLVKSVCGIAVSL